MKSTMLPLELRVVARASAMPARKFSPMVTTSFRPVSESRGVSLQNCQKFSCRSISMNADPNVRNARSVARRICVKFVDTRG